MSKRAARKPIDESYVPPTFTGYASPTVEIIMREMHEKERADRAATDALHSGKRLPRDTVRARW